MTVDLAAIRAARSRIAEHVAVTPLAPSRTLSALTKRNLVLKFENLQFTASFKERGALNRLCLLTEAERERGVVAMSAGNHAQALAYHGGRLKVPVTIVMPRNTPNAKVRQTSVFGAEVLLRGDTFAATLAVTQELATERGATLVHPFDDEAVIAGQGTLGLELLEQAPDLHTIVVPVGGGGLIAGIAVAARSIRPDIHIVGVQTERFAAVHDALQGKESGATRPGTVAEGIAVETPGSRTLPIIRQHVDRVVTVTEAQIEDAVFTLLEVEKTVTEGAGACPLAAVKAYPDIGAGGTTALVLTGGNIDMMILSSILQRGLVRTPPPGPHQGRSPRRAGRDGRPHPHPGRPRQQHRRHHPSTRLRRRHGTHHGHRVRPADARRGAGGGGLGVAARCRVRGGGELAPPNPTLALGIWPQPHLPHDLALINDANARFPAQTFSSQTNVTI